MNCVVTAGPTYEALDEVRRLTNFSTGRLGTELANHLAACGHHVTLLIGEQATHRGERRAQQTEVFTTTADLARRLQALGGKVEAVFHAAAVSDFAFGKVWTRSASGELKAVKSGKLSTREGTLLAELVPTRKIIASLREWHPRARLVGWKFEVEGGRAGVIALGERQIAECRTDACVVNGKAYGEGFGLVKGAVSTPIKSGKAQGLLVSGDCVHLPDRAALFKALEKLIAK